MLSVTSSAEYCEQYVAYACRMSRLLNSPGDDAYYQPFHSLTKNVFTLFIRIPINIIITHTANIKLIFLSDVCVQKCLSSSTLSSCLLRPPDGVPFTWWLGRANEKHSYWGGSGPGIQKCACGIEHNCTDPKHYCNCDADLRAWWVYPHSATQLSCIVLQTSLWFHPTDSNPHYPHSVFEWKLVPNPDQPFTVLS